LKLQELWHEGE
jgi:hypothetical protein